MKKLKIHEIIKYVKLRARYATLHASWRKVGCAEKNFLRRLITFIIHLQNATNTEQIKLQL